MQPAAQPVPLAPAGQGIVWADAFLAATLGGLFISILMAIPIVGVGSCLWMLGGGALAVMFYRRRRPEASLSRGMGARLGALTGFIGFLMWIAEVAAFRSGGRIVQAMRQAIGDAAAQNTDANAQQVLDWVQSPAGLAAMLTIFIITLLLAFLLFSVLGGLAGVALWGQRRSS